jgi:hypothetical protein
MAQEDSNDDVVLGPPLQQEQPEPDVENVPA